jgi:uncharacterized protein (DUF2062 family)
MVDRARIRGLTRFVRLHWLMSVHRARDPHASGLSFGMGVFLGFLPMGALATVVAILVSRRAQLPLPAAVAGTLTGNWITAPFIYAASLWTGSLLTTGHAPVFKTHAMPDAHWYDQFFRILSMGPSFLLGIVLVSLLGGVIGYFAIRTAVTQVRKIRHAVYAKHIERLS